VLAPALGLLLGACSLSSCLYSCSCFGPCAMSLLLIYVSSGFALGCSLPTCLSSQCAPALVPHATSVILMCVSSWSGFALGCSLPLCLYSQCASALVPHAMSVILICVSSWSGFALGCSLPLCLYSQCVPVTSCSEFSLGCSLHIRVQLFFRK
jgi:hypothetical protein